MDQFVGNQLTPTFRRGSIVSHAKDEVLADGVGIGGNGVSTGGCLGICVHPDTAEVVSEARLDKCARSSIKRLPRRAQHVVDDGRDLTLSLNPSPMR
jgi:hypothetical protein